MTRSYGVEDFMAHAARLEAQLEQALRELTRRSRQHRERVAELGKQRDETLAQLTAVLLPDLSPAALARAGRAAAYGRILIHQEALGRLEAEREALTAQLADLEADPRWRERELLRAPRVGKLARELDELVDFRAPVAEVLATAAHPRLDVLLANGYGTEAYQVPWWRVSYYGDWKAGDEILERFPGKTSFGELRAELVAARDTLAVYDARLGELRHEIALGEAVERRREDTLARLRDLDLIHLTEWRGRLARHLAETELAELGDRLAGEDAAQLLAKTYVGLVKKLEYLERVHAEQIGKPEGELRLELQKLQRDRVKYLRPKNAYASFDGARFEKRFGDRGPRFDKHWRRYDRTYDTVWSFNHYERASFAEDFLWWDLMTDGQIDGNFIPEVQEFHRHHPGYAWHGDGYDDDLAGTAAHAVIEADREPGGAGTSLDPS